MTDSAVTVRPASVEKLRLGRQHAPVSCDACDKRRAVLGCGWTDHRCICGDIWPDCDREAPMDGWVRR